VNKTAATLLFSLTACAACGLIGFRLGITHNRHINEAQRTDMSVASSAGMGNMTRIWLSQLEDGQINSVHESMLGYIQAEHTSLSAYFSFPDVRNRNISYKSALEKMDLFLKEHEKVAQQAGAGYPPQGVGSPDP
jgi:hypothetical protein